jgi:hypothetical protein
MKSSSKMSGILKWKHPIFSSKEKHPETEKRNEAITLSASHKSFSASFIGYLMQKKDEMRQKKDTNVLNRKLVKVESGRTTGYVKKE